MTSRVDRRRQLRERVTEQRLAEPAGCRRPDIRSGTAFAQQAEQSCHLGIEVVAGHEAVDRRRLARDRHAPRTAAELVVHILPWGHGKPDHDLVLVERPLNGVERGKWDGARRKRREAALGQFLLFELQQPQLVEQGTTLGFEERRRQ